MTNFNAEQAEALPEGTRVRKINWSPGHYIYYDPESEWWLDTNGKTTDSPLCRPGCSNPSARVWETYEPTPAPTKKEPKPMLTKTPAKKTAKQDLRKAMVRTGVTVCTTSMTKALVAALKKSKVTPAQAKTAAAFLATPTGEAVVRVLLGYGLTMAPVQLPENFPLDEIAEELRVSGMAIVGLGLATVLQAALVPAFQELLPMLQGMAITESEA